MCNIIYNRVSPEDYIRYRSNNSEILIYENEYVYMRMDWSHPRCIISWKIYDDHIFPENKI
jgi:hypothetical protein